MHGKNLDEDGREQFKVLSSIDYRELKENHKISVSTTDSLAEN
jgi:hypothetical protein